MSSEVAVIMLALIYLLVAGIGFWLKTVAYLLKVNVVQKVFEDSTRRAHKKEQ